MQHEKVPPVPEDIRASARLMANNRSSSKQQHTYYSACDLCGYLTWTYSQEVKEGEEPTVSVIAGGQCPRCQGMALRHPEVVEWVATVLGYHLERWHDPENVAKSRHARSARAGAADRQDATT